MQFTLIDGFATQVNGAKVFTRDIDITPATEADNPERLASALADPGAGIRVGGEPPVPFPHDAKMLSTVPV